jgi:protein subunit release factor B
MGSDPVFAVSDAKLQALRTRMAELGIGESDLAEEFIRSSGPGGQHVNRSATCVRLVHVPTGLEVKCMRERSQSVNRFIARRELVEKVARHLGLATPLTSEQDQIRRRKARKRRRTAAKGRRAEGETHEP